jgi:cell wall-associated NlpC family hydrolase
MKLLAALYSLLFLFSVQVHAQEDSLYIELTDSSYVTFKAEFIDSVLLYAEKFKGCRYGYGSCGPKSFDCSGFVMTVFGKYGMSLPHSSGGIAALCEEVKLKKVRPGDLLFFSGRKSSKKSIGHVAIVKAVEDDKIWMIHATVQAGVMVEEFESSEYFRKRFIQAGRLPVPKSRRSHAHSN